MEKIRKLRVGDASSPALHQEIVDQRLNPSTTSTAWGDERRRLQKLRDRVRATLRDAEQRRMKSESTALWLRELQDLADDIDDVLDDFEYEALRCKVAAVGVAAAAASAEDSSYGSSSRGGTGGCGNPDCFSNLCDVIMTCKIAGLWRKFDGIAKEREALRLPWESEVGESQMEPNSRMMRETTSFLTVPQVIGRDDVKEEMMEFLVGTPEERLSMLAVVGIGGVGKTTLAKFVYNDIRVGDYFHQRIWVRVSGDFDVKRVTRQIIEHVVDPRLLSHHQMDNLNVLQNTLANTLTDKRFLLVLDDMWYEDRVINNLESWEALCAPLMQGGKGSKILVTTRSAQVAGIDQTVKTIQLVGLEFDHSWSLFKRHAFLDGNSGRHPNLEDLGKKIVKKLKGVPLAVAAIGSILCSELEESEWSSVLESELWELEQGEGGIMPSLRLSYEHLPPHLRPCFAYVSAFPKGLLFHKLELIQLWMAMGYIQSHGNNKRMEDVGGDYLHCLLRRSLIQNSDGQYVVHDLLHDLGRFILLNDFCAVETDQLHEISSADQRQRNLSLRVSRPLQSCELDKLQNFKKLHALFFWFSYKGNFQIPFSLFMNLACLRVLDLSYGGFQGLPDSIGNLRHLRYLDLSITPIAVLPESLCSLYMLQTLKLEGCDQLEKLPEGMSNLVNLRYLKANPDLVSGISGIAKLAHLQELQVFSISEGDEGIKIGDLKDMDELRGRLCIHNLQRVVSIEDARRANLKNKKYIKELELEWAEDLEMNPRNGELEEAVLDAFVPPPRLKELTIGFYNGVEFPCWMDHYQSISGLESISLRCCRRWATLPPLLGQLPFIKTLDISCCPHLEELPLLPTTLINLKLQDVKLNIVSRLEGLSKLQELVLCNISNLRDLPPLPTTLRILTMENLGLEVLPEFYQTHTKGGVTVDGADNGNLSLKELKIVGCQKLRALGGVLQHHLPYLAVLSIMHCKELQCWPDEEGFQATLLSLGDEFCIENCPRLTALPKGSIISSSLKKLIVQGCPGFPDKSLFVRLQDMKNLTREGDVYVEKQYWDFTSCSEEALHQMRTVNWLVIEAINNDGGVLPLISLVCDIIKPSASSRCYRRVTLKISSRISHDDEDYYSCNSMFLACLRHHHLCSSLIVLSLYKVPSDGFLLPRGRDAAAASFSPQLSSLEKLTIFGCRNMERLPVETLLCQLKKLKYLTISGCPELTLPSMEEAIQSLPSLVRLKILGCPKMLLPIPDSRARVSNNEMPTRVIEELSSSSPCCSSTHPPVSSSSCSQLPLQALVTDDVGLLANTQFAHDHLTSLRDLSILHCRIESLPVAKEEYWPRSLRVLSFFDCPYLRELPPDSCNLFPSLKVLSIEFCPRLRCVPEMGLPASLEALSIDGPPGLREEDWPKVAHVRLISICCRMVKGSYSDYQEMMTKGMMG